MKREKVLLTERFVRRWVLSILNAKILNPTIENHFDDYYFLEKIVQNTSHGTVRFVINQLDYKIEHFN